MGARTSSSSRKTTMAAILADMFLITFKLYSVS